MNRRLRSPVSHSGNVRLLGECQGKLESGRERAVSVASCLQLHSICPLVHSRTTAWPVAVPILTEQPPPTGDLLNRGLPRPPESFHSLATSREMIRSQTDLPSANVSSLERSVVALVDKSQGLKCMAERTALLSISANSVR